VVVAAGGKQESCQAGSARPWTASRYAVLCCAVLFCHAMVYQEEVGACPEQHCASLVSSSSDQVLTVRFHLCRAVLCHAVHHFNRRRPVPVLRPRLRPRRIRSVSRRRHALQRQRQHAGSRWVCRLGGPPAWRLHDRCVCVCITFARQVYMEKEKQKTMLR
jgi:hypothetical protein